MTPSRHPPRRRVPITPLVLARMWRTETRLKSQAKGRCPNSSQSELQLSGIRKCPDELVPCAMRWCMARAATSY
eukprot:6205773-Pleurochrysis_carterae.AAC.2